jgi:uncharacterized membrane protein YhaH (DUF805 family)
MIDDEALNNLERLHKLKADGVISEADFEDAKSKLLAGEGRSEPTKQTDSEEFQLPGSGDHLAWMPLPLKKYANFQGRSARKDFWMFLLFTNLVAAVLTTVLLADTNSFGINGTIGNLALGLLMIGFLAVIVPYLAVQVRRFHDQGRSGWFVALNIIPYLGALIVLGFMLVPGQSGSNDYGADPYA